MRYTSKRQWAHPVLRPGFDDWPNADRELEPVIELDSPVPAGDGKSAYLELRWKPAEKTIQQLMESGAAELTALVYCPHTLYRDRMEQHGKNPFQTGIDLPLNQVRGRIEVHPLVVATANDIELDLSNAHEDYGLKSCRIERGQILAAQPAFETGHDPEGQDLESFVRLETRLNDLPGQFIVVSDLGESMLRIGLHQETLSKVNKVRKTKETLGSLYLPALVAACYQIANAPMSAPSTEGESISWNQRIDELLLTQEKPRYIARNVEPEQEDMLARDIPENAIAVTPEEAAQLLLDLPVNAVLTQQMRRQAEEASDGTEELTRLRLRPTRPVLPG